MSRLLSGLEGCLSLYNGVQIYSASAIGDITLCKSSTSTFIPRLECTKDRKLQSVLSADHTGMAFLLGGSWASSIRSVCCACACSLSIFGCFVPCVFLGAFFSCKRLKVKTQGRYSSDHHGSD